MRKTLIVVAAIFALAASASAGPILSGVIGGQAFCAVDNQVAGVCTGGGLFLGDLDPSVGNLSIAPTTIAGVSVVGSFQQQIIGPTQDILNSSSLQIINNTLAAVAAAVSIGGINFLGPVTAISNSGAGTWQNANGSTINMQFFADMNNAQGGEAFNDFPGILLFSCGDTAVGSADAFSCSSGQIPFGDPNLFSMTQGFTMNLTAGGSLINRGQTMLADIQPVPEPATMMLLGTGLIAAFRARRRLVK